MKEKIEELLKEKVISGKIPGANYAIISGSDIIKGSVGYKAIYNEYDAKNNFKTNHAENNSLDTLYDLASLSKVVVTNTIISRMIYKGLISENDKVNKFLPRYKHDTTIKELLTHMSGLPKDIKVSTSDSKENTINKIYDLELEYEPNTMCNYSDIGFIILGFVIESVYGKTLDEVAKIEVFNPLEMNNTCYNPSNKELCAPSEYDDRGIVRGYVHDEKCYVLGGVSGHAGVFSTIDDLSHFVIMIMNEGKYNNQIYLPKSEIEKWFNFDEIAHEDESYNSFRTNGWICGDWKELTCGYGNKDTILHTGFTGTSITINREENIATILLTNRVHPTRSNRGIVDVRTSFYKEIATNLFKNNVQLKRE